MVCEIRGQFIAVDFGPGQVFEEHGSGLLGFGPCENQNLPAIPALRAEAVCLDGGLLEASISFPEVRHHFDMVAKHRALDEPVRGQPFEFREWQPTALFLKASLLFALRLHDSTGLVKLLVEWCLFGDWQGNGRPVNKADDTSTMLLPWLSSLLASGAGQGFAFCHTGI